VRSPPRPTLLPYTTLFRSGIRHPAIGRVRHARRPMKALVLDHRAIVRRLAPLEFEHDVGEREDALTHAIAHEEDDVAYGLCRLRSEEHTSELQSRENLVCR